MSGCAANHGVKSRASSRQTSRSGTSSSDATSAIVLVSPLAKIGPKGYVNSRLELPVRLNTLAEASAPRQSSDGRPHYQVFEATEVLDLFTGLERALASAGSDARSDRPARLVPSGSRATGERRCSNQQPKLAVHGHDESLDGRPASRLPLANKAHQR